MNSENKYIRFDWAAKRMLRDKANFAVLEGREQGEREAKRQIALAMMQQGLPAEQICRLTGLTADELVAMQQG